MNYVYILHSKKDGNFYVGCTNNLNKRVREHNSRMVASTRNRTPLALLHYEAFVNKSDAFFREKWLKTGWGRNHIQRMLSNTIKSLGGSAAKNFLDVNYSIKAPGTKPKARNVKSLGG